MAAGSCRRCALATGAGQRAQDVFGGLDPIKREIGRTCEPVATQPAPGGRLVAFQVTPGSNQSGILQPFGQRRFAIVSFLA